MADAAFLLVEARFDLRQPVGKLTVATRFDNPRQFDHRLLQFINLRIALGEELVELRPSRQDGAQPQRA